MCTGRGSNVFIVKDRMCRGSDVYEDPSAWQGEEIFKLLKSGDLNYMICFKSAVKRWFSRSNGPDSSKDVDF